MIRDTDIIIVDDQRRDLSLAERFYLPQIGQGLSCVRPVKTSDWRGTISGRRPTNSGMRP